MLLLLAWLPLEADEVLDELSMSAPKSFEGDKLILLLFSASCCCCCPPPVVAVGCWLAGSEFVVGACDKLLDGDWPTPTLLTTVMEELSAA